jgi:hypothetical protein
MKRVLILAYAFPPYILVGGLRPYNWYKYLKEFDVDPVVITRQWSNKNGGHLDYIAEGESSNTLTEVSAIGTIIKTPYTPNLPNRLMLTYGDTRYKFIRKAASAFYELGQFIFPIGSKYQLFVEAKRYLEKYKVDVIITTGEPFILFLYAAKLSKQFDVPWVADYRDPWSSNDAYANNLLLRKWYSFFEKRTVKSAIHITTVSRFIQEKIATVVQNMPYKILPNGYDPAFIEEIQSIQQGSKVLQIAFAGSVYKWNPIESFLRTVSIFLKKNIDANLRINFYGTNIDGELRALINNFPILDGHIFIHPKIQNDILLQKLAQNNVMLLFNYYSYLGTKIFDYLGIRRKILLCYSNDAESKQLKERFYAIQTATIESEQLQAELIEETKSGVVAKDSEHLLIILNDLYNEFTSEGSIKCNSIGIENYSRKIQVENLANLVKNITAKKI